MTTNQTIDGVLISAIADEMNRLGYGLHESHAASILCAIQKAQHHGEPVAKVVLDPRNLATLELLVDFIPVGTYLYDQPAPVAVTLQQVLSAYEYAESHPHKYLRGTTNWCAAVAWSLSGKRPTHANPPPGAEPCGTHHDNDGLDDYRNTK